MYMYMYMQCQGEILLHPADEGQKLKQLSRVYTFFWHCIHVLDFFMYIHYIYMYIQHVHVHVHVHLTKPLTVAHLPKLLFKKMCYILSYCGCCEEEVLLYTNFVHVLFCCVY